MSYVPDMEDVLGYLDKRGYFPINNQDELDINSAIIYVCEDRVRSYFKGIPKGKLVHAVVLPSPVVFRKSLLTPQYMQRTNAREFFVMYFRGVKTYLDFNDGQFSKICERGIDEKQDYLSPLGNVFQFSRAQQSLEELCARLIGNC